MRKIAIPFTGGFNEDGFWHGDTNIPIESPDQRYSISPGEGVLKDSGSIDRGALEPVEDVDWESYILDDEDENACVEVISDGNLSAIFSCDLAKTMQQKIAGLQAYPTLSEGAGLLFPYSPAQDVIYHMGTVSYPIDIIFVDSSNAIKKIYRNIQPGTLATFGCADVKSVLEICGGLSDRLGISKGDLIRIKKNNLDSLKRFDKISEDLGVSRGAIIKFSSSSRDKVSNWNGYPIITINENSLIKNAKKDTISDLVLKFVNNDNKKIYAFDFDGLIEESPMVRVYKTSAVVEDDVPYIRVDGATVSIDTTDEGSEIYRDVHLYELLSSGADKNESIIKSLNKSFRSFIKETKIMDEAIKIFKEVKKASRDSNSRIIFLTRSPSPEYVKDMVSNRIDLEIGETGALSKASSLQVPEDSDAADLIAILKNKFGTNDIKLVSDNSLLKRAGMPVPDEAKEKAKRANKLLESAIKYLDESLENMNKNLSEYDKLKDSTDKIPGTKGQYHQSVKRNTKIAKKYLIAIRDTIKILNDIKDMSSTFEIIDSLASSAKNTSNGIEEIFDLIEQIDSPNFFMILGEKTGNYANLINDMKLVISRAREYINSNILGLVILSD